MYTVCGYSNSISNNETLAQTVTLTGCNTGSYFRVYTLGDSLMYCEFFITPITPLDPYKGFLFGELNSAYYPKNDTFFPCENYVTGNMYSGTITLNASNGHCVIYNHASVKSAMYGYGAGVYVR